MIEGRFGIANAAAHRQGAQRFRLEAQIEALRGGAREVVYEVILTVWQEDVRLNVIPLGLAPAHLATSESPAYPLSKIGVRALAKREAPAFGKRGARIVSLSPGAIDTDMGRLESAASPIVKQMVDRSPIGRLGRPEELAAVAVFLCSPKAGFVTGVDWLVDAGQTTALGF